jgi:formate hydrogenlyase transcriptional activator
MNKEVTRISEEVMEALLHHDWPGNIRELQNVVERAVIISSGRNLEIPFGELKRMVAGGTPTPIRTLDEAQRDHILEALRQSGGVVAGRNGAAVRLGLARATLEYRMRKLGIVSLPAYTHCYDHFRLRRRARHRGDCPSERRGRRRRAVQ